MPKNISGAVFAAKKITTINNTSKQNTAQANVLKLKLRNASLWSVWISDNALVSDQLTSSKLVPR